MNPEVTITKQQSNRIIGLVLGDGHLTKPRKRGGGSKLVFRHGSKQLEYLEYKKQYMENMGIWMSDIQKQINTLSNGKSYTIYYTYSSYLKVFEKLRKKLYPYGKKTIRMPVVNSITIEDLVHIILDDGSIQRGTSKGVPKYAGINIAFDCFTYKENEIFLKAVKRNLGITGTIHYKKGQPYIYFGLLSSYQIVKQGLEYFKKLDYFRYKWQAFNIIDAKSRVLNNSESLSDREIVTRLMLKYLLFPHSDMESDKELIIRYYGSINNFIRSRNISAKSVGVKDMIQTL